MISRRRCGVSALLVCVLTILSAGAAGAWTFDEVRRDGWRVSEALAIGGRGDWRGAEAAVAESDRFVRDIVLWRKLRAGQGSIAEYDGFVARRPTWPGHGALARVVHDTPPPRPPLALSGRAKAIYSAARRDQRRDRDEQAEQAVLGVSTSREALQHPALWAPLRSALVRSAVRQNRAQTAYQLASRHFLRADDGFRYADLEWLSGWIALRDLAMPDRAVLHFERVRSAVGTPISLARAGYWLGRAHAAAGRIETARQWYAEAAGHQTTFYGQLAAEAVGAGGRADLTDQVLPSWRGSVLMELEDVRLALTLHFGGERRLAMTTLSGLADDYPPDAVAALAGLMIDIGEPTYAIRIAKRAARRGLILHPAYYPLHDVSTAARRIEPALALAIARQETEMDPAAISPAGARGFMQLMPATARKVAGWIGEPYSRDRLTEDWRYNVRLGEEYLRRRIDEYSGSYVLAAAAYNAGASRVDRWIAQSGDPRMGRIDIVDWIELIPFEETRNYVQRVVESLYVYRSRLDGNAGPMTISRDLARGIR